MKKIIQSGENQLKMQPLIDSNKWKRKQVLLGQLKLEEQFNNVLMALDQYIETLNRNADASLIEDKLRVQASIFNLILLSLSEELEAEGRIELNRLTPLFLDYLATYRNGVNQEVQSITAEYFVYLENELQSQPAIRPLPIKNQMGSHQTNTDELRDFISAMIRECETLSTLSEKEDDDLERAILERKAKLNHKIHQ
jgi:hypothetical protein